jgi:diguanylate cyclase (GGDEF)-like protein/PAS domain S-box-containing protein/putative nucleotidyltransferase with HDIG domain
MIISALKKLLTNNNRFKPDNADYRRIVMLNIVLVLFIDYCVMYAIFNLNIYNILKAVIDMTSAVLGLSILIFFHKTDKVKAVSYALIAVFFLMIALTIMLAGPQGYILVWLCVLPPLAYFLLSRKEATVTLGIMLTVLAVFIGVNYRQWSALAFDIRAVSNLTGVVLAVVFLVWYFELSRSEAAQDARLKNSQLDAANAALMESRESLRLILDSTAEAIFGVDMENRCTFCNKKCLDLLGYADRADIIGKEIHELIHSRRQDNTPLPIEECNIVNTYRRGAAAHSDKEVFTRSDSTCLEVEYYSYPQYKDGILVGAVVTFGDNAQKKLQQQQIEYYGSHDSLTGLMNRRHFHLELSRADTQDNLPISIIMTDLNGLKLTNDVFGHDVGDELIVKAAGALKKSCRNNEIIARLGGDEFAILLTNTRYEDAVRVIARIKDSLAREEADIIQCSMSVGCDTKTSASQNIELTLKNAENGMYKDKTMSRSRVDADMLSMIIMSLYRKCPLEEQHSMNVSDLCRSFGEALRLPEPEILQLARAGLFHDIGKICIDEEILNKRVAFKEEEKIAFKQHPVIGYRLLNLFDNTLNLAEAVYSHHERWDGKGYPRALRESEIPLFARIISIAGRYDRYISGYQEKAVSSEQALRRLREEAGALLDPQLVQVFTGMIRNQTYRH